jgi:hypothetical protein
VEQSIELDVVPAEQVVRVAGREIRLLVQRDEQDHLIEACVEVRTEQGGTARSRPSRDLDILVEQVWRRVEQCLAARPA